MVGYVNICTVNSVITLQNIANLAGQALTSRFRCRAKQSDSDVSTFIQLPFPHIQRSIVLDTRHNIGFRLAKRGRYGSGQLLLQLIFLTLVQFNTYFCFNVRHFLSPHKIMFALIITAKCAMSKEKYSLVPKIFNGSFPAIFYMRGRKPRRKSI